jgi:hypothetical protein
MLREKITVSGKEARMLREENDHDKKKVRDSGRWRGDTMSKLEVQRPTMTCK